MDGMNAKITQIVVYETTDYEQFGKLKGNRNINEAQVIGIRNSIEKIGYQPVPILVNERLEVIDGQHRLEAARTLGIPIYFIIQKGAGRGEDGGRNCGHWRRDGNREDHDHLSAERRRR